MLDITPFVKAPKNKQQLSFLRRKYYNGIIRLLGWYNTWFSRPAPVKNTDLPELNEVRRRAATRTDINDHLEAIFLESLSVWPKVIVELGIGPGESTFVFERVVRLCGSKLISVDLADKAATATSWPAGNFVQADDIEFAGRFKEWAKEKGIDPFIDVLFIDTSHQFEHTVQEIKHWFPFLSETAKVFFHDTNTGPIYRRKDGSIGLSYDINRGVIRALEQYFDSKFDEKKDFADIRRGWIIKHFANCNGLTILEKLR